jgi:hypothetical protein
VVGLNLAVALVCAAIGLVALPLTLGSSTLSAEAWSRPAWLVIAVLTAVCLLGLLPRLSRPLATTLGRQVPSASTVTPSQVRLSVQLVVLGVLLVIVQAILRRPLALLIGGAEFSAASLEAVVAATALTLVLALLVWLYQSARPLVQAVTARAIDSAFPTVAAAPQAEPTRTLSVASDPTLRTPSPAAGPTPGASPSVEEPTLRAPSPATEPTLPADAQSGEPTLRVTPGADEPRPRELDPDATLRADEPRG